MKNIRFRGKCLISENWIYGQLIEDRGLYAIVTDARIYGEGGAPWVKRVYEVDGDTVGQYIGVNCSKHVAGGEVYEGDICRNMLGVKGKIVFERGKYLIENKDGLYHLSHFLEVLGNVYDNPEMMEENGLWMREMNLF